MARKARITAFVVALVAVAGAATTYYVRHLRPSFDPERLTRYYAALSVLAANRPSDDDVRAAIERSGDYLRRMNLETGQFVYLSNMDPSVRVPPQYNLLRHAGAVYSLGMADSVIPNPQNRVVMRRAVDFMRRCCMTPFERDGMIGIWEPESIVHQGGPPTYKLGGAGLALIAMTSLADLDAAAVPLDELNGVARFGRYMQRWDGQFYSLHEPAKGGRRLPGKSLYYPGEMALGWLKLYELHGDRSWLEAAVKALRFLAKERAVSGEAPADHWALLATAQLFELERRDRRDIPHALLSAHALQICHAILEQGRLAPALPIMEGALVARGEVTPTATRLEGLLAARTFLPDQHPITPHVDAAINRGISFLVRAQVREGQFSGGMPYAITVIPNDSVGSMAAFNRRATEIRIDYVQHALSAMVQYLNWSREHSSMR